MMKPLISPVRIIAVVILLVSVFITFGSIIEPVETARALALTVFTIGFWATGVLPGFVTTLAFFALAMLFSVSPPAVIFSGFKSSVFWLVFGGLVLGVAIKQTGLGGHIANRLSIKFGKTYAGIITGIMMVGLALSFIMPSAVGRIILLLPIASALAERYGFARDSKGHTGIIMAATFGSFFPAFAILPANVPNLVLAGAMETLYHYTPGYVEYFLLHFPVLGLLKAIIISGLILILYPDRPIPRPSGKSGPPQMSTDERRLILLLALTIAFWLTDFLHHISPAWIALSAGVICFLPMVRLVPDKSLNEDINYSILFFLAGVIGLGGMVSHSGIGNKIAKTLLTVLPLEPGASLLNFTSLSITAIVIGVVTNLPSVPAVMTPLADEISRATGLPVKTVLMTQVLGFSTVLFPYQSPPLVLAIQVGKLKTVAVIKFCLVLAFVTIFFLVPLDFFWWQMLGWI